METFLASKNQLTFAPQQNFTIEDITGVAPVRRQALKLAASLGFGETESGRIGIVVTELATNIVKYAGAGELVLRCVRDQYHRASLEILALDRGPGIANLAQCAVDGVSTSGTAGGGLGAIQRLADDFQVFTESGKGSVFYASLFAQPQALTTTPRSVSPLQMGVMSLAKAGEDMCGDAWYLDIRGESALLGIADGLGHGPDAATAAQAALGALTDRTLLSPPRLLDVAHQRARPTRGAAVAFAMLQPMQNSIRYAAVGNIAGAVCAEAGRRPLISHNGIVGHNMRKVQEFAVDWPDDAAVVLHSDGLSTQWDLRSYAGLSSRHPALIAAVLYRDFCRATDDITVVVIKHK